MRSKFPTVSLARHALLPAAFFLLLAASPLRVLAQSEKSPTTPATSLDTPQPHPTEITPLTHRFWDKENDWLFAGVGASRTLDYFSTLNLRRRGRQEALITNDAVDNHAAFAVIEAAGTGVSIAGSYMFHHYGHHTLERWTSIVHIGLATGGAIRNYSLKTAHFAPPPPAATNSTLLARRPL